MIGILVFFCTHKLKKNTRHIPGCSNFKKSIPFSNNRSTTIPSFFHKIIFLLDYGRNTKSTCVDVEEVTSPPPYQEFHLHPFLLLPRAFLAKTIIIPQRMIATHNNLSRPFRPKPLNHSPRCPRGQGADALTATRGQIIPPISPRTRHRYSPPWKGPCLPRPRYSI